MAGAIAHLVRDETAQPLFYEILRKLHHRMRTQYPPIPRTLLTCDFFLRVIEAGKAGESISWCDLPHSLYFRVFGRAMSFAVHYINIERLVFIDQVLPDWTIHATTIALPFKMRRRGRRSN